MRLGVMGVAPEKIKLSMLAMLSIARVVCSDKEIVP